MTTNIKFLSLQTAPTSADDAAYIASAVGWAEIRNSVFDGTMFRARTNASTNHLFTDRIWSTLDIDIDDLSEDIAAFEARNATHNWDKLRYNFFYFNTFSTGGVSIDWFSAEFNLVIQHLKTAGEYAARCNFVGLFMDLEPYGPSPWQYSLMPQKNQHTFAQYEARVYEVAKEVVTHWLKQKPNMQIMFSVGYEYYYAYLDQNLPPALNDYGFSKAWLNGIYDGVGEFFKTGYMNLQSNFMRHRGGEFPGPKIILSNEGGYALRDDNYKEEYIALKEATLGISDPRYKGDSVYFDAYTQFCLALRADYNGANPPKFDNSDPPSNYHTPTSYVNAFIYASNFDDWIWNFSDLVFFYQYTKTIHQDYIDEIAKQRRKLIMWQ